MFKTLIPNVRLAGAKVQQINDMAKCFRKYFFV